MRGFLGILLTATLGVAGCTSLLGVDFDNAHPVVDGGAPDTSMVPDTIVPETGREAGPDVQFIDAPPPADAGCRPGLKLCGTQCVSTKDPLWGCGGGSCSPCSIPYGTATCSGAGACAVGTCESGRADCDGNAADGCEVDTTSDVLHCGTCPNACIANQVCSESTCTTACGSGLTNCNNSCVNVSSDPAHCGGCTSPCLPVTNGVPTCTASVCGVKCNTGYHDCSGSCVTDSPTTCGLSCTVCPTDVNGTTTCTGGMCGLTCFSGYNLCAGVCTANGPLACGATCAVCSVPANGQATCNAGTCGIQCNSGYSPCGSQCCPSGGPILTNGDFELGALTGWTSSGSTTISTMTPHGGMYDAMLGSPTEPSGPTDSILQQSITIPATGTTTLSFWYNPNCTDSVTYDWQAMTVQSTGGSTLATPLNFVCDPSNVWKQITADLTPYAGQTIVLNFLDHDDGTILPTYMLVDDVTVTNQ